mmetsp:Transcript_64224/g.147884  ORF Transcript_64224/g.147884 Transcript_64224/m.147884 type:complete len:230 (-) Transcript_64224:889-1578(-)
MLEIPVDFRPRALEIRVGRLGVSGAQVLANGKLDLVVQLKEGGDEKGGVHIEGVVAENLPAAGRVVEIQLQLPSEVPLQPKHHIDRPGAVQELDLGFDGRFPPLVARQGVADVPQGGLGPALRGPGRPRRCAGQVREGLGLHGGEDDGVLRFAARACLPPLVPLRGVVPPHKMVHYQVQSVKVARQPQAFEQLIRPPSVDRLQQADLLVHPHHLLGIRHELVLQPEGDS